MLRKTIFLSIFFLLFSFVGLFGVKSLASAQRESVVTQQDEFAANVSRNDTNRQQFSAGIVNDVVFTAQTMITGCGTAGCENVPALQSGALPATGNFLATLYKNKPADTQRFVADLMQSAGVIEPAYAQGLGFSSLRPILELWKTFRNIAYVMFVLIFLIIGFAIMFRQKIGGQAEVTVQQAIPKVIVALLAVTFSYAIAGLLIDLMYVFMFFLVIIFQNSGLVDKSIITIPGPGVDASKSILSQNIFQVGWGIITNGFLQRSSETVGSLVNNSLSFSGLFESVASGLSSILVSLVLFVVILVAVFKTLLELIKIYFEIIVSIIFSPIVLMMGTINNGVFFNWIKGLFINLLVFPALLLFILVGYMFMGIGSSSVADSLNQGGFLPPFLPGRGDPQNIALIAGIGSILMMAKIPEFVTRNKPKSIFSEIPGLLGRDLKQANALALPGAGLLGGGAIGTLTGALRNPRAGVGGIISNAYSGMKSGAAYGAQGGLGLTKKIENTLEGKLPITDPNSWEAALLDMNRRKKSEEDATKRKERRNQRPIVG